MYHIPRDCIIYIFSGCIILYIFSGIANILYISSGYTMLSFLANYTFLLGLLYPYCAYLNGNGKHTIRANYCHSTRAIGHVHRTVGEANNTCTLISLTTQTPQICPQKHPPVPLVKSEAAGTV